MPLWNENAVAVERRGDESVIIGEGTLAALVAGLKTLRASALNGVRVSMPDRHVPPSPLRAKGLLSCSRMRGGLKRVLRSCSHLS